MDPISLLIGVAAIGFGAYTLFLLFTKPESFGKLQAMKDAMGNTAGNLVHLVAYSIVPIIVGVVAIFLGIQGISFF
jgi:uncharacterized membrane protein YdfJ with MMPL/SSD domain